jgi:hypothetical protein
MAKPWFAPKRYGYGAGLPISPEGWLALAAFVGGASAASRWLHGLPRYAALATGCAAIVVIGALKTKGGWRWRWGSDE